MSTLIKATLDSFERRQISPGYAPHVTSQKVQSRVMDWKHFEMISNK